jgi:hypothetical protein
MFATLSLKMSDRTYMVCNVKSQARFSGRSATFPGKSLEKMPLCRCFWSQMQRIWLCLSPPESMRHIKAKYVPGLRFDPWLDFWKRRKGANPLLPALPKIRCRAPSPGSDTSIFNTSLCKSGNAMSIPLLVNVAGLWSCCAGVVYCEVNCRLSEAPWGERWYRRQN